METSHALIPEDQYKFIVQNVPIVCVDVIVRREGRVLLLRRRNEPLKGEWWIPGGRIDRGEKSTDAAIREVFEETGLRIERPRLYAVLEGFFDTCAQNCSCHSLSLIYEAESKSGDVKIDKESSDFMWSESLPEKFNGYYSPWSR